MSDKQFPQLLTVQRKYPLNDILPVLEVHVAVYFAERSLSLNNFHQSCDHIVTQIRIIHDYPI